MGKGRKVEPLPTSPSALCNVITGLFEELRGAYNPDGKYPIDCSELHGRFQRWVDEATNGYESEVLD